jgi:hypothetical protein
MKVIIDRFEGDFAVCEKSDRTMLNIKKDRLPAGVKEGDTLAIEGDNLQVDHSRRTRKKKEIEEWMRNLWK